MKGGRGPPCAFALPGNPSPSKVHLPGLRQLLLNQRLHSLAQEGRGLHGGTALCFRLDVQQAAEVGVALRHLRRAQGLCLRLGTSGHKRGCPGRRKSSGPLGPLAADPSHGEERRPGHSQACSKWRSPQATCSTTLAPWRCPDASTQALGCYDPSLKEGQDSGHTLQPSFSQTSWLPGYFPARFSKEVQGGGAL